MTSLSLPCSTSALVSINGCAVFDLGVNRIHTHTHANTLCSILAHSSSRSLVISRRCYYMSLLISQMPSKHITGVFFDAVRYPIVLSYQHQRLGWGGEKGCKALLPPWPACSALIYYLKCHGEWMSRKGSAGEMYMTLSPSPLFLSFIDIFMCLIINNKPNTESGQCIE